MFIDSSKQNLKCVLLHNDSLFGAVSIASLPNSSEISPLEDLSDVEECSAAMMQILKFKRIHFVEDLISTS